MFHFSPSIMELEEDWSPPEKEPYVDKVCWISVLCLHKKMMKNFSASSASDCKWRFMRKIILILDVISVHDMYLTCTWLC